MRKMLVAFLGLFTALSMVLMAPAAHAAPQPPLYYSLGDSYAAGIGNAGVSFGDMLVATNHARYGADLAVGGATTNHIRLKQVPAVGRKAKLVTFTTGGNDVQWAAVITLCLQAPSSPDCAQALQATDLYIATVLPGDLDALYRAIHRQAPSARVVSAGYPLLFPNEPAYAVFNGLTLKLNAQLEAAAMRHDATFVDVVPAFYGHDVMSPVRWLNNPGLGDADVVLHPNAAGQQAYFRLVVAALPGNFRAAAKAA